ncbi:MAG TPA: hypothetical protein VHW24_28690 [Bryobacteraceae bacterium]|jgi:hypothetical protein|nr:hypothetical protein [Bryobacteraceae bacterium]
METATIHIFPTRKTEYEWEVIRLRCRGEYLGTVKAADEDAALQAAVKMFALKTTSAQKQLLIRRA